jgi:hypothetical protein
MIEDTIKGTHDLEVCDECEIGGEDRQRLGKEEERGRIEILGDVAVLILL